MKALQRPVRALKDYIDRADARTKERKAERKAHWQSISRLRRNAYRSMFALLIAIAVISVLTKTVHTGFILACLVSLAMALIVRRPRWRRMFAAELFTTPVVLFPVAALIGGYFADFDYDRLAREQAILAENSAEITVDGQNFLTSYKAGNVKVVPLEGEMEDRYALVQLGANDKTGYEALKTLMSLGQMSAPEGVDTTAMLPLPEMFYADHVVMLYDQETLKKRSDIQRRALEDRFGMPFDDIPVEDRPEFGTYYSGIFMLSCMFKNNGELLMATGMPAASMTDLRNVPGAEPFIEACQTVIRDTPKNDLSVGSIIAQAFR